MLDELGRDQYRRELEYLWELACAAWAMSLSERIGRKGGVDMVVMNREATAYAVYGSFVRVLCANQA